MPEIIQLLFYFVLVIIAIIVCGVVVFFIAYGGSILSRTWKIGVPLGMIITFLMFFINQTMLSEPLEGEVVLAMSMAITIVLFLFLFFSIGGKDYGG